MEEKVKPDRLGKHVSLFISLVGNEYNFVLISSDFYWKSLVGEAEQCDKTLKHMLSLLDWKLTTETFCV